MRQFVWVVCLGIVLSACGTSTPQDPTSYARDMIKKANKTANITEIVAGNSKYRNADQLWCIETDANSEDGQIPYLLAVWYKGGTWNGEEITDGFYQWDLYGCARPKN
jgi:hypothetical protein